MSKQLCPFKSLSMTNKSDKWVMCYVIQVKLFSLYQSIIWLTPQILQFDTSSMSKQFDPFKRLSKSIPSDKWVMSYVIQVELSASIKASYGLLPKYYNLFLSQ